MLWKHAAHLLENTTVKVWFYWNHKYVETALRHGCSPLNWCILSEHIFLRTPLEDCFATLLKWHFVMGVLLYICWVFSEHLFLRTLFECCFWIGLSFPRKSKCTAFFIQTLKHCIQSCIHVLLVYPACIEIPLKTVAIV